MSAQSASDNGEFCSKFAPFLTGTVHLVTIFYENAR